MKCRFINKKLEELYLTGKSRKYKLTENVIINFCWLIEIIEASHDIYDFWGQPALNFEKLKGCDCRYSFRINKKYRLEVEIEWENEKHTVGIVGIDELSMHYR